MSRPTLRYPLNTFFNIQGYHFLWLYFPESSAKTCKDYSNRAVPLSLATTNGISVDFYSCSYLDVSVRHVRFACLCIQHAMTLRPGFPIRKSADQCLFAGSPQLIASYYVLHRLISPRHPPCALIHLSL